MNKNLVFITLSIFATIASAAPRVYRIDTGATNLSASFGTDRVFSELVKPQAILIDNNSNQEIELNCMQSGESAPPVSELDSFWVRSSTTLGLDEPNIKGDCWLRAVNTPATSGVIIITINADN